MILVPLNSELLILAKGSNSIMIQVDKYTVVLQLLGTSC